MRNRGVSEVIGFVLVFSIVTATIGIVYATGFPGLQDASEEEQFQNMGRAFDVLADNIRDLHQRGAPSRATEIKLGGGTIKIGKDVSVTVDAVNTSNSGDNDSWVISTSPILYEDGETKIVYSTGAVLREQDDGAVMLSQPGWFNDSERTVIPFISTYARSNDFAIGGQTTVLIVTERRSQKLRARFSADNGAELRVNVTVESPRAEAWKRFFTDRNYDPIDDDPTDDNVTYQFNTTTLYIPETGIETSVNR